MKLPLQVTFRNVELSEALEANIREKVAKLETLNNDIMSCRVVVEAHKHKRKGRLYDVRVDLKVPDQEIVVSRNVPEQTSREDVYVAVRDAFAAIERQLREHSRRRRGEVKSHAVPPHGRVREINPQQGYGRIETGDGREVYFHRNSLVEGNFGELSVGTEVRFVEETGEIGPQASSVYVVGKHHIAG